MIYVFSPLSTASPTLPGRILPLLNKVAPNKLKIFALHHQESLREITRFNQYKIHYYDSMLFIKNKDSKKYYSTFSLFRKALLISLKTSLIILKNFKKIEKIIFVKSQPIHFLPFLLAKILNIFIIIDIDDIEFLSNKYPFPFFFRYVEEFLIKKSNLIIVATPYLYRFYLPFNRSIHYIPTPINARTKLKQKKKTPKSDKLIKLSYFGSVSRKRLDILFEAFNVLHSQIQEKYRLVIAGYGQDLSYYKNKYQPLVSAGVLSFFGEYTSHNLPSLLEETDVIVDPQPYNLEGKSKSSSRLLLANYYRKSFVTFRLKGSLADELLPINFPGFVDEYSVKSLVKTILYIDKKEAIPIFPIDNFLVENASKKYKKIVLR